MLDVTKFEYVEVEMPNVSIRWERGKDRTNYQFGIDKEIKELIVQAAIKFPMWKFVGVSVSRRDVGNNDVTFNGYRFYVYDDKEHVGELSTTYSQAHGRVYCLTNDRILKARERGSATTTKDLNKALKIMGKLFGAKTIQERLREADDKCQSNLGHVYREKHANFTRNYETLTNRLAAYLMSNWDITKKIAETNGVDLTLLDSLPNQYEDYKIAKEIGKCYQESRGVVVTIHGNDYAVKEKESITIYGTENLPEHVKRCVGMLKLVEPNHLIGGVGFKISERSFFVMKGAENE